MKTIHRKDAVYSGKGNGSSLAEFVGRTAEIRRSNYAIARTRLTQGASEEKHHHVITEEVYLFVKGS